MTWTTSDFSSPFTSIAITSPNGGVGVYVSGIQVDGVTLIDIPGLVLALPLVGEATDESNRINSETTTKTVTNNSTVTFPSGVSNFYNGSALFSGSNSLTVASNSDFAFPGDFTWEMWIHPTSSVGSHSRVIEFGDTSWAIYIYPSSDSYKVYAQLGSQNVQITNGYIENVWTHIAVVKSGSTAYLFINGTLRHSAANSSTMSGPRDLDINGRDNSSYRWPGYIQDLRIYAGVAKYTGNFVPASANPDVLPNSPSGVSGGSKLTKITDGAVHFDGTGDYLEVASTTDFAFGTGDFTLEAYIYATSLPNTNNRIFCSGAGGAGDRSNFQLMVGSAGYLEFDHSTGYQTASGLIGTNKWYHVAATREGTSLKLFIDGVLRHTGTSSVNVTEDGGVTIGREFGYSSYFNGFISNARILKGTALYTANFTPPTRTLTNVTNTKLLTCQSATSFITGGQPILNTNSTGSTTTSGTRIDSNASYLSLCIPLNGSNGGTTFTDQSPTGRTTSALTFTRNGDTQTSTSQSNYYGSSGYFDGTGDYLTSSATGSTMTVGSGDFTIELWIYWNSFSGSPLIVSAGTGGFSLGSNPSGDIIMYRNGAGGWGGTWSDANMTTGKWYHIAAVTSTSGTWEVYLNGISIGTQSGYSGEGTTSPLYIGGYGNGVGTQLPNAYIQDIRIYKGLRKYSSNFNVTAPLVQPEALVSPSSILSVGDAAATNFNPFNTDINTVRGQETGYCTFNPLDSAFTLSNGNLTASISNDSTACAKGSLATPLDSGKWFWEFTYDEKPSGGGTSFGAVITTASIDAAFHTNAAGYGYYSEGNYVRKINNNSQVAYGTDFVPGDTIGVALNLDSSEITFFKNGVSQGVAYSSIASGNYVPAMSSGTNTGTAKGTLNCGQKPFKFPPPDGFQPLNFANTRPETVITRPDQYVEVTTYTGNQTARTLSTNFAPDFVWTKRRDDSNSHQLYDSVRGDNKILQTDNTNDEDTVSNSLSFSESKGINIGSGTRSNENSVSYVAWAWRAGGNKNDFNVDDVGYASAAAAGLSAGTITPLGASVGTKQGFSIVKFHGNQTGGATVPHGLSQTPDFTIVKQLTGTDESWRVKHRDIASTKTLYLNQSREELSNTEYISGADSTTIALSTGLAGINADADYIMYAWHSVPGLQKFGKYEGNQSTNGTYVELGFRPALIWVKNIDTNSTHWVIVDKERDKTNPLGTKLAANLSNGDFLGGSFRAECDFLSNGFKMRGDSTDSSGMNASNTYVYCAWAEAPSTGLYGAQSTAR